MNKLLIYNKSLSRGGAERVTVYLADYMVKNGIECEILTERVWQNEYDVPAGVKRTTLQSKGYFSKIRIAKRNFDEAKKYESSVLDERRNAYYERIKVDLKSKDVLEVV